MATIVDAAGPSHLRPDRTAAPGRWNVPLAGRETAPIVGWPEAEEQGNHFRVATRLQSNWTAHGASIPDARNVTSADVVETDVWAGESRWNAQHTACRVRHGTENRTGRRIHWENARACAGGEIGRDGTRIRTATSKGIVSRRVGQQWQAGREGRTGPFAMTRLEREPEDAGRDETGLSGPGEDRTADAGTGSARCPELLAPERIGHSRPNGRLCFNTPANGNARKGWYVERQCRPRGRENL